MAFWQNINEIFLCCEYTGLIKIILPVTCQNTAFHTGIARAVEFITGHQSDVVVFRPYNVKLLARQTYRSTQIQGNPKIDITQ